MAQKRQAALLFSIATALFLPALALAQGSGLVPCGVGSDIYSATSCQACDVIQLAQNIIMFLIGLTIPLAAVLFAWAGVLYFTSGAGGSENISKAKKIFKGTLVGFILTLGAWLIVNTILYTVLDTEQYPNSSWFHIECSTGVRPIDTNIGDVLLLSLGLEPVIPTAIQLRCDEGYSLVTIAGGEQICRNSANEIQDPERRIVDVSGRLCSDSNPACSVSVLQGEGLTSSEARAMSCIAVTESSGNPSIGCSATHTPCGLYQINNGNWDAYAPADCRPYAKKHDGSCNRRTALIMLRRVGYQPWTGHNENGVAWNPGAMRCVNSYDPNTTLRR